MASASSTVTSTAIPTSPNFSHVHRSSANLPLSPTNRQGTAATPPLSPSRKKDGPHQSVMNAFDKKDADILKASIKATSTPSLTTADKSSTLSGSPVPNLAASSSHHLSSSIAAGTISSSSSSSAPDISANDSSSYKSRLIASLTPTRSLKPLRRPSLFSSKSDNNIKERLERCARAEAVKPGGTTPLKSLLSLGLTNEANNNTTVFVSGIDNSSANGTGGSGTLSEPSTMEIDDQSECSGESSSCQESERGQREIDVTDVSSSEDVEMTNANDDEDAVDTIVEVGALTLNVSLMARANLERQPSATTAGLPSKSEATGENEKLRMVVEKSTSTSTAPTTTQREQSVVVASMMDFEEDTSVDIVPKNLEVGVNDILDNSKAPEDVLAQGETESPSPTAAEVRPAVAVCQFQQQLALQEQMALEASQQQQQQLQEVDEDQGALGSNNGQHQAGFKSQRKRISSLGGKKLQLKKKTSLPNLHSSFQQQHRQDSPTLASLMKLESGMCFGSEGNAEAASVPNEIPPFYFPMGKPVAPTKRRQRVQTALSKAKEIFAVSENGALTEDGFVAITVQCCELPRYMNRALLRKVDVSGSGEVRFLEFERVWETLVETCPDEISMIFMILKQPGANVVTPADFEVVLQDLVLFHPGLEFLAGNAVFQERYLETVITRIFYESNRRHGRMTLADLRKSGFEKTLRKLENSDLNQTEDCFSYKHFYVIYCKFWELDQDHDLILDEKDLAGYAGGAISARVIRRVMQGYGNETGMFMIPDQDALFLQRQQQLLIQMEQQQQEQQQQQQLQQQQLQQQQHQQQEAQSGVSIIQNQESSDMMAVSINMDIDQELATAIDAMVQDTTTSSNSGVNPQDRIESDSPLSSDTASPTALETTLENSVVRVDSTMFTTRVTPPGPGSSCRPQNYRMTYKGFIWFLLAETDKQTVTSIEYWFRCMDLDGDGILTVFELEQLFKEQAARMSILGMESFGFRDAICQMQDLVSPRESGWVRLADLKQCGQAGPFIDLFCNVVRWRAFEAHQHQIRMRQQQIAMQRAADAAWEEVASCEEVFDVEDDDEDNDENEDEDGDDEGSEDEEYEDEEDDESIEGFDDGDEEEGIDQNITERGEEDIGMDVEVDARKQVGLRHLRQKDLLLRNAQASTSTTNVSMVHGSDPSTLSAIDSPPVVDQEVNCIGLGVELSQPVELENNGRESVHSHQRCRLGGHNTATLLCMSEGHEEPDDDDDILICATEVSEGGSNRGSERNSKILRRTRAKEKRRRQKSLMHRALLEEQRKEKALLATIRESPWLVYVEAEYEKLVTIERPQSRTGWEHDEDEDEEEEEEEEEEIGEAEEEEEVMEEEEMMEQGHEGGGAVANESVVGIRGKHVDIEDANLLVALSDSEGGCSVGTSTTNVTTTSSTTMTAVVGAVFEIGHDFEQISMEGEAVE
ncbi:Serine/threonine-protein phosphatase 2A regulatory subunit B'' subunit alpha [Podila humilis]|nr:Serine/threonine-protein phosphatase 2A regulatory subunit B'' subunit alpha [Podila humilis]